MPIEVNTKGELITPAFRYVNLRSESMTEIISRKPGFVGRWALFIFLLIITLLFAATWFIQYPDVVKVRATLIATNAPKPIICHQEGRLMKLFVNNNENVLSGEILGYIESNASHEQVKLLSVFLDSTIKDIIKNNTQEIAARFTFDFDSLGELQQDYQQFISSYQHFIEYLKGGFYLKKKEILSEDFNYLQKTYLILEQQKELLQKDLSLSEDSYKANEFLLKEKIISRQDERNEQSKLLGKLISIPQINASLLNNQAQQRTKQNEINELEHSIMQQKITFQQSVQTFQNLVNEWIKKYILSAPISGKIVFLTQLQENQFLKAGYVLGFIDPKDTRYSAEVYLPQYNFGKVDTGQQVQLHFDAYPYQEFGFVKGSLKFITDFATDSGFLAQVQLSNGLETNLSKKLPYRDGLKADGLIIIKDMRLIDRFYYSTLNTLNR